MWKEVEYETIFSDHGQIHMLELPKFRESWEEATDEIERWLSFLKEAEMVRTRKTKKETSHQLIEVDKAIAEAYKELERLSQDPELNAHYEAHLKHIRDYEAGLEGKYLEGRLKGKLEERQSIVKKLKSQGFALEEIATLLEIPLENLDNQ